MPGRTTCARMGLDKLQVGATTLRNFKYLETIFHKPEIIKWSV